MQSVVSVANMRESDAYTIAHEVPSLTLMGRAAYGIYQVVDWGNEKRIGIVVGSGNNGGDGSALAWILSQKGISSAIYTLSEKLSPDHAYYLGKARELGVPIFSFAQHGEELADCGILVDCILGTGFQGGVRGLARQAIEAINQSSAFVVSADINSGLHGDTGEAELAVHSDLTVSIGSFKTGMFWGSAPDHIRRLVNVDIGIRMLRQEYRLCPAGQEAGEGEIPCPAYCQPESLKVQDFGKIGSENGIFSIE